MNLTYDKSKITWEFENNKYEYVISGMAKAYFHNKYIYIDSRNEEYTKFTNTYITLKGLLIVSASYTLKGHNKFISLLDENNKQINVEILDLIQVHADDKNIYAIAGRNENEKLLKLSLHGKIIREYLPPTECTFERFFNLIDDDKKIEVICNAKEYKEGASWQWCFELDTETGQWQRKQSIDGH
jgi:hypothetical protein